jgi:hypothetical protein
MANKVKRKRRLRKELKRRPKEINIVQIKKTDIALRNIFVKAGILKS